jgi:cytochrome c oxidase subunit II
VTDGINHFRRVVLIWLLASVIATPLVIFVLAPIVPPGNGTVESSGQVTDNTVLFGLSTPIALAVIVYFLYAVIVFRERDTSGAVLDGPPLRGDARIQMWWVVITTTIVLFLAGYGSVRLLSDGAGGGQGPNPIAAPSQPKDPPLQVQVIAQQWQFTYRFPGYGGVETQHLEIPANTTVAFNVTSLDVIHSFWAYQLGVKADANPGENNIAYVTTKKPLTFNIRCAELCGVWHGYMFDTGHVVPKAQFARWIAQQRVLYAPATKLLPPYGPQYFPQPTRRGG